MNYKGRKIQYSQSIKTVTDRVNEMMPYLEDVSMLTTPVVSSTQPTENLKDGLVWFNDLDNSVKMYINGQFRSMGGSGGGSGGEPGLATGVTMEYGNAVYARENVFMYSRAYVIPPSVTANLVFDYKKEDDELDRPGRHIMVPIVKHIINNIGGVMYYRGCRVYWTGDQVPVSINNAYTSMQAVCRGVNNGQ